MLGPPLGAVKTAEVPLPMRREARRREYWLLVSQPGDHDTEPAARPEQPGHLGQVQVGRAEVVVGVDTHDSVELGLRERQAVRLGPYGCDPLGGARRYQPLLVFSGRGPP